MRSRHLLKVVDERVVHRCTAERANKRHGLRRQLLRHNNAEAGCDLCDRSHQHRHAFRQDAAINDKASSLSNRLGEQPTYRKVAAVRRICPAFEPAQGEHLQTIQSGLWIGQVFALASGNIAKRVDQDWRRT